jgi:FMN phosphatase YigB (HAD superfamily)
VEAIFQEDKEKIEKEDILLLDDDINNVNAAIDMGHRSMQVQVKDKDIDYDSLDSFERMLRIAG